MAERKRTKDKQRSTKIFKKRVVHIKLDIYDFISAKHPPMQTTLNRIRYLIIHIINGFSRDKKCILIYN